MAIEDAIAGLIGDVLTPVINSALKGMGYSELGSEKIQNIFMWLLISVFCAFLIGLTLIYS